VLTIILSELFRRDLNRLKSEINSYADESLLWITEQNIKNSAGNLCLHIVGNLQYYIGNVLGNTGYVRNREAELGDKNISKVELLNKIDKTSKVVNNVLEMLSEELLTIDYPIEVFNKKMTTDFFLIHLTGHLNYHLGQINYHRRLLDK